MRVLSRGTVSFIHRAMEAIKSFFTKVAAQPELEAKLQAATSLEEVVALARAEGVTLDEAEVARAAAEISDAELAEVAAGSQYSATELLKLQDLMQRLSHVQEMQSGLVNKTNDMMSSIVRNIS
jgi:predicted ribosomally synthesized peptide with nif11-like leader